MIDDKITKIAVIVAMEEEIAPLLRKLGARKVRNFFGVGYPMEAYEITLGETKILFSINGTTKAPDTEKKVNLIGTVAATINTLQTIELFKPDILISSGTAGGFAERGAEIGDVYLGTQARFHDRRIGLPGFREVAERGWPLFHSKLLVKTLKLKSGIVSTADSFDMSEDDRIQMSKFGADAKEMEAAAIAMLASFIGVPVIALKAITDLVDSKEVTAQDQFLKHLEHACERLCDKLHELLMFLAGKRLSELQPTQVFKSDGQ
jgi:5'-methylthioadenosine/S-adenosylhomocysteine nucleosidase